MEGYRTVIISRNASEDIDETAAAFKDIMDELGVAKSEDDDSEDLAPSCCFFLFLDCLFLHLYNIYKSIKDSRRIASESLLNRDIQEWNIFSYFKKYLIILLMNEMQIPDMFSE